MSMPKPFFSIIIPTYNRGWIISKTIEQIRSQSFNDWELIVIDDGSTDNTKEIIEKIAFGDNRINYIYQKNARQSAARQNGINRAAGKWVTYIDSDDEPYPYYLETAYKYFLHHSDVWYAFAYNDRTLELHDEQHKLITDIKEQATDLPLEEITLQSYSHWQIKPCGTGIFHRRDILDDIQWDTTFKLFEDIDFVFQLGLKYPNHFGFIPTPLFHQRQVFGNDGICAGASYSDWADGFEKLFKKYENTWLMEGQKWYPGKVESYREKQNLFNQGLIPSACQRHFPEYFK